MYKLITGLAVALALAFGGPALAQKKGAKSGEEGAVEVPKNVFLASQSKGQNLARNRLIGAKVVNKDGQTIGDIEDLILSSSNQVEGVIMGVGGFLGLNEKKIGVRYSALKIETKDGRTVVSLPAATKEVLAKVEAYKYAEARPTLADQARGAAKKAGDAARGLVSKEPKKDDAKKDEAKGEPKKK